MKALFLGITKLTLGVFLAFILMSLAGVATARYFMAKLSVLPPKPVYENDVALQVEAANAQAEAPPAPVETPPTPAPARPYLQIVTLPLWCSRLVWSCALAPELRIRNSVESIIKTK
jgi:hypothetical protein